MHSPTRVERVPGSRPTTKYTYDYTHAEQAQSYATLSHRTRTVGSDGAPTTPARPPQASPHAAQRPSRAVAPPHVDPRALPTSPRQAGGWRQRSHVPRRVAHRARTNGVQARVVEVWGLGVVGNSPCCAGGGAGVCGIEGGDVNKYCMIFRENRRIGRAVCSRTFNEKGTW